MSTLFIAEGARHVSGALQLLLSYEEGFDLIGVAADAETLLARACMQPPDVILLDWSLPGIHPRRLLAVLRQHCPETHIITTGVNLDQERMAMAHGFDAFIYKDQSPQKFLTALRVIIQKSKIAPN